MAALRQPESVAYRNTPRRRRRHRSPGTAGFTLLEMLIVITIIGILLSIAIPSYRQSVLRARETALKENLFVLRSLIEQFTLDKLRPPTSLEELVTEGYLRALPKDITGSRNTWEPVYSDLLISPEQTSSGISDVRSGSSAISTEGTPYNTW
ncbi:MAG: type IV pilin protein [Terriglobia bacterium]